MDKFFNSTFDALTNVVPGALFLFTLTLLDPTINTLDELIQKANTIELGGGALIILLSYVIGFAMGPLGKLLYQKIGFHLWPITIKDNTNLSVSDKFILVREFSPTNFKYIESWNMFCSLAHNLALASITLCIVALIRIFLYSDSNIILFIAVALFALCLFFIFINRAVIFREWALKDLNAAIITLDLSKKATINTNEH